MVDIHTDDKASVSSSTTAQTKAGDFKFTYQTKESIIQKQHEAVLAQKHLSPQTLEGFDSSKITPLSPEIISRQATINIGTIGHVAHGKSTLVKAVSGTNVSTKNSHPCADRQALPRDVQKHHNQARLR